MTRRADTINRLVEIYREIISRPTPIAGYFRKPLPGNTKLLSVHTTWTQRNLERSQPTEFQTTHLIDLESRKVNSLNIVDTSSEILSSLSNSELRRCVVRQVLDGANKKQYLEVWQDEALECTFDLAALDVHGQVYTDGEFGTLSWSPNEEEILYVAEKKRPKSEPFYKQKTAENSKEENIHTKGEEHAYVEDWGEQLVGKSQPVVFICDVKNKKLSELTGVPDKYSPGQLLWDHTGDGVFGIGVENTPRRLGLIYCTNRNGIVFHLSKTGTFRILSQPNRSPRSCRLSPDGTFLIWLERNAGGPHHAAHQLVKCELTSGTVRTIVPIIKGTDGPFLGIFDPKLPERCFASDGKTMVFNTSWKTCLCSFSVNTETSELISIKENYQSIQVLDVFDDRIICTLSSATTPASLLIGGLPGSPKEDRIQITEPKVMLPDAITETINLEDDGDFNCLLISPINPKPRSSPLIVYSHGGPHSVILDTYMLDPAFFVTLGFTILFVNYRGSTGNGQACVDSLPGRIGDLDVKNIQFAVDHVIKTRNYIDPNKVVAYGGSHGGYLSLQLSGQYPSRYHAVVVRNPVVDLPSMLVTSDIPDWVVVESLATKFNPVEDPKESMKAQMTVMSPIRHIGNVKAPTLLLVGTGDLRVHPSQSIYYYNALKARGIKTKLHLYNDCHPLSKVPVHMDCLINSGLWILEALDIDILNQ